ncbi:MAG: ABC transporter permease, partial [Microbacteriaceae bacterium]|nr:ABC transporter permease [Microbacteriaceae bacterium]
MLKYILRRLGSAVLVLFSASVIVYVLVINSGDPLQDLRESNQPNREQLMRARTENMGLELPWYQRYGTWLAGVGRCFIGQCDLGLNREGQPVTETLAISASSTLRLVIVATILAIIIGVAVGIITAIRQYSGLDYAVTFGTFLFFSLPTFWAAVMLKVFLGIGMNKWIEEPTYDYAVISVVALLIALAMQAVMAGSLLRRAITAAATFATVLVAFFVMEQTNFAWEPQIGPVMVAVFGAAAAVGLTALFAGIRNTRVLYAGLVTAALSIGAYFIAMPLMDGANFFVVIALGISAIAVGILVGNLMGGIDKRGAATV